MRTYLRKPSSQFGEMADEVDEVVAFAAEAFPVDPAGLVVLAIGIVVAVLTVAYLIAGQNQRQALRQQQAGQLIFPELTAKRCDRRIVGRAFMAAIGAVIFAGTVAIVFAVGQVVFLVVAEQVSQREAVMHGDMIDAGAGPASIVVERVGRAGHAARHFADQAAFAAPVAPHRAAIAVIPLRPLRWKSADLIAAHSEVPGLGYQLHRGQYRVLPDR